MASEVEVSPVSMTPDGRFTTEGAAQYVGLSRKTMAQMRCEGRGPKYLKIGKIFYRKADLDEWLSAHRPVQSTSEARQVAGSGR